MKRLSGVYVVLMTGLLCSQVATAQRTPHHEFGVTARRYAFEPPHLDVHQGDLVRITVRAADIPHSFVIDAYRIAKKANPGEDVTFEFLADRVGDFPFYCNLALEDGCRQMKGQLIVRVETSENGPSIRSRTAPNQHQIFPARD